MNSQSWMLLVICLALRAIHDQFINNVEDILLVKREENRSPCGKSLLRAIRNKIEVPANGVLNVFGTPLIWDNIKTNLLLHYSDKKTKHR